MANRALTEFVAANVFPCWCGELQASVFCRQLFRKKFAVLKCDSCGTHRILPRVIGAQTDALALYNDAAHTRAGLPLADVERSARTALRRMREVGIEFDKNTVVLDIGCSEASILGAIHESYGSICFGVDVDADSVLRGQVMYPALSLYQGFLEENKSYIPQADVTIVSAIIEHVLDPVAFLREARSMTKAGGSIFILTPNAESLNYRLQRSWWRELLSVGEHVYLFTPSSLAEACMKAGFEATSIRTDYDPIHQPRLRTSTKEVIVWAWSLVRNSIKAVLSLMPRGRSGDLLYVRGRAI